VHSLSDLPFTGGATLAPTQSPAPALLAVAVQVGSGVGEGAKHSELSSTGAAVCVYPSGHAAPCASARTSLSTAAAPLVAGVMTVPTTVALKPCVKPEGFVHVEQLPCARAKASIVVVPALPRSKARQNPLPPRRRRPAGASTSKPDL
jgi:hypothetical protein